MRNGRLCALLVGLAFMAIGSRICAAAETPAEDCSGWMLDGYHLGMPGSDLLAIRSVTLHVEGQAQAIEPGKFRGVLVLDALNRLEKWAVVYDQPDGEAVRAEMSRRFGKPVADVTGNIVDDDTETLRQRRSIWRSTACDAAIIVYEDTFGRDRPEHSVHATLTRASKLTPGIETWKTLRH